MQLLFSSKTRAILASAVVLVSLTHRCFADPITLTSSAVSSTLLSPSSDTISLNSGSVISNDSDSGPTLFQTGDLILGNSNIPNQVIPFSIQDTLTLNGTTELLTILGQDDVTTTADTLSIFAGTPITFGNDIFTLEAFNTIAGTAVGQVIPIDLQASITPVPTPEPSTLVLLGSGIIVAIALSRMVPRSRGQSIPPMSAGLASSRMPDSI